MSMGRHPVDRDFYRRLGIAIRERRILKGLKQSQLAAFCGVTYQQAHKWESGQNRIGIDQLVTIAAALETPLMEFFGATPEALPTSNLQMLHLARSFALLSPESRAAVMEIVNALAQRRPVIKAAA